MTTKETRQRVLAVKNALKAFREAYAEMNPMEKVNWLLHMHASGVRPITVLFVRSNGGGTLNTGRGISIEYDVEPTEANMAICLHRVQANGDNRRLAVFALRNNPATAVIGLEEKDFYVGRGLIGQGPISVLDDEVQRHSLEYENMDFFAIN